jgi:hypothetical protein
VAQGTPSERRARSGDDPKARLVDRARRPRAYVRAEARAHLEQLLQFGVVEQR